MFAHGQLLNMDKHYLLWPEVVVCTVCGSVILPHTGANCTSDCLAHGWVLTIRREQLFMLMLACIFLQSNVAVVKHFGVLLSFWLCSLPFRYHPILVPPWQQIYPIFSWTQQKVLLLLQLFKIWFSELWLKSLSAHFLSFCFQQSDISFHVSCGWYIYFWVTR